MIRNINNYLLLFNYIDFMLYVIKQVSRSFTVSGKKFQVQIFSKLHQAVEFVNLSMKEIVLKQ